MIQMQKGPGFHPAFRISMDARVISREDALRAVARHDER
ncbi:hypothetical protein ACVIHI_004475 [Bradyrhizobium sp. USDA 4524]|nr:hypothetical protein [Bradyrhizobium sp. USDA 4538]MCP1903172.1 hypothetical protein [Bradyrhizobium sp. USDA 4537]MCP1991171.1 hypothetical protein [Bradyrhizobium sp. USDA 4539]